MVNDKPPLITSTKQILTYSRNLLVDVGSGGDFIGFVDVAQILNVALVVRLKNGDGTRSVAHLEMMGIRESERVEVEGQRKYGREELRTSRQFPVRNVKI